jgi:hypothetical protein
MKISPLVWLLFILLFNHVFAIPTLSNGIRELIHPESVSGVWILILQWLYMALIGILTIVDLFIIIFLYWLITKFISVDKLEDIFYKIKNK